MMLVHCTEKSNILWPNIKNSEDDLNTSRCLLDEFDAQSDLLFCEDNEIDVDIIEKCEIGTRKYQFRTIDGIKEYVQSSCTASYPQLPAVRFLVIRQSYSWGKLRISREGLQMLFTHLNISNQFWQTLKLFGAKHNADHEFLGGLMDMKHCSSSGFSEASFTLKHVAKNGKTDEFNSWSIRQVGVHHMLAIADQSETMILINPPQSLQSKISRVETAPDVDAIYRFLTELSQNPWSDYLLHLESLYREINKKALLSKEPRDKDTTFDLRVQFSDSQYIQKLQDILAQVCFMLQLNITVWKSLIGVFPNSPSQRNLKDNSFLGAIDICLIRMNTIKTHAENLLQRLMATSVLVRSILESHALEELRTNSRTTAELASIARDDSKRATKKAQTLNTITILGFIYLPASFVAAFLDMDYVSLSGKAGESVKLVIKPDIWIFVVMIVAFLLITGATWAFLERRSAILDRKCRDEQFPGVDSPC